MIDDDLTLFGIEAETTAPDAPESPIRPEQVRKIRQAFENAGIASQQERKTLVDSATHRDVVALRELTAIEGRRVLEWIKSHEAAGLRKGATSWDMREEDTWIDKL